MEGRNRMVRWGRTATLFRRKTRLLQALHAKKSEIAETAGRYKEKHQWNQCLVLFFHCQLPPSHECYATPPSEGGGGVALTHACGNGAGNRMEEAGRKEARSRISDRKRAMLRFQVSHMAKRRKKRQDDHCLTIAADPGKMAEERQDREKWSRYSGKKSKAGQRRKNEG